MKLLIKKNFFFFLFFLNIFLFSFGQNKLDSLKKDLAGSLEDTNRVKTFCLISKAYFDNNTDSSMKYASKANELAKTLRFKKGEWQSLNLIANILSAIGDYPKALQKHIEVLKILEELKDPVLVAVSQLNIAEVYRLQPDYDDALKYYFFAKEAFEKANRKDYLLYALMDIGETYENKGVLDSAINFQNQANTLAEELKDKDLIGSILTNQGNIYSKKGETELAFSYYNAGIRKASAIMDYKTLANAYYGIAVLLKDLNRPDSAIYNARQAMRYSSDYKNKTIALDISKLLSQLYSLKNKTDSALVYSNLASDLREEIHNQENVRLVQKLKFDEESRQKNIAIEKEEQEKKRLYNLQMFGAAIFIVSFFTALILISKRKVNRRVIKFLGLAGLLFMFEFISQFIHPYIVDITSHVPLLVLGASVCVAGILVPVHDKLQDWVKNQLGKRKKKILTRGQKITGQNTPKRNKTKVQGKVAESKSDAEG